LYHNKKATSAGGFFVEKTSVIARRNDEAIAPKRAASTGAIASLRSQ
jgi:hypothetical protein